MCAIYRCANIKSNNYRPTKASIALQNKYLNPYSELKPWQAKRLIMVWRKEFTDREKEITNLISLGLTNDEISKKLSISEPTVKTHLRNIYSKTDIHDRANLAIRVLNSDKD
mgnify:CR=1 FL=1|jgi:DNA-binding NarL/FixJ family response regulator